MNSVEDYGKKEPIYTAGGSINNNATTAEVSMEICQNPTIPL